MKIFLGKHDHKTGSDLYGFATRDAADAHRFGIAHRHWHEVMTEDKPDDPEELADQYFERMAESGREFYVIVELDVEDAKFAAIPDDDQYRAVMAMAERGGGFAQAIATAWLRADASNRDKLRVAFDDLFMRYVRPALADVTS